jgi:hypothetical protein
MRPAGCLEARTARECPLVDMSANARLRRALARHPSQRQREAPVPRRQREAPSQGASEELRTWAGMATRCRRRGRPGLVATEPAPNPLDEALDHDEVADIFDRRSGPASQSLSEAVVNSI